MCTDKPDIHRTLIKKYHGNQPIIISFDIEHVSVIAHRIYTAKRVPNIIKISLINFFDNLIPTIQSCLWSRMLIGENINERLGDDYHDTKIGKILYFEIYFIYWNTITIGWWFSNTNPVYSIKVIWNYGKSPVQYRALVEKT